MNPSITALALLVIWCLLAGASLFFLWAEWSDDDGGEAKAFAFFGFVLVSVVVATRYFVLL